jgi:hypothetical protein
MQAARLAKPFPRDPELVLLGQLVREVDRVRVDEAEEEGPERRTGERDDGEEQVECHRLAHVDRLSLLPAH